jgi:hypothetical protein
MWDIALISKSAGIGILAGLVSSSFINSALAFLPVFVIGAGSIYYLGQMNSRMTALENSIKEINNRLDKR